jgi:hypothetical protein
MPKLVRITFLLIFIFTSAIISAYSQSAPDSSLTLQEMDSPAAPSSGQPNLYTDARGRTFMSWIEPVGENRHALRFAMRSGGKWSEPRTIAEGSDWQVNWANFPSIIALPDGTLAAHWLVKNGAGAHTCDVKISRSIDGGKTWSKPLTPHRDGTPTEHGFVSMMAIGGARAGAVWLDGRKFKSKEGEGAHTGHHGSLDNEMTLRYATIGANGQLSEEAELDARVCDCCQTSAAMTSEGPLVVYRDRSEQEIRDISVIRFYKGKWTAPQSLHADGWRIEGCPVNGPSVTADGKRVAVAWFAMVNETQRVNVAFSNDAGASFTRPIQVDEGEPLGRVGIVILGDGSAVVSWLERAEKGGEIKARRIRPDGTRDGAITIAQSSNARATGFPRLARTGNEIVVAWTDSTSPTRVRTAVMKIAKNSYSSLRSDASRRDAKRR